MTVSELLPCPFCGGAAESVYREDCVTIRCKDWAEGCMGAGNWADAEPEAITAWNRRTPARAAIAAMQAGEKNK